MKAETTLIRRRSRRDGLYTLAGVLLLFVVARAVASGPYGTCDPDNNKPTILCHSTSQITWDDTSHCNWKTTDWICSPTTNSVTHHVDSITWTPQDERVMGALDGEGGWYYPPPSDIPSGGCADFLGPDPDDTNYGLWAVWSYAEHDVTSQVQGADCGEVYVGY